jgi:hypothetical protein
MHSLPKLVVFLVCHQGVTFLYINSRDRQKFPQLQRGPLLFRVTRSYYFDKWRGEICTTVNGKRAFRLGVGWK